MGLGEASVYPIAAAGREARGVPGPVLELRLPPWDPGKMGGAGKKGATLSERVGGCL